MYFLYLQFSETFHQNEFCCLFFVQNWTAFDLFVQKYKLLVIMCKLHSVAEVCKDYVSVWALYWTVTSRLWGVLSSGCPAADTTWTFSFPSAWREPCCSCLMFLSLPDNEVLSLQNKTGKNKRPAVQFIKKDWGEFTDRRGFCPAVPVNVCSHSDQRCSAANVSDDAHSNGRAELLAATEDLNIAAEEINPEECCITLWTLTFKFNFLSPKPCFFL